MPPTPWTASTIAHVNAQPPTMAGLVRALAATNKTAGLLPEGPAADAPHRARAVRAACRAASGCLDADRGGGPAPAPAPTLDTPDHTDAPIRLYELEAVITACIDLAVELLDNEDEPLAISQVTAIGQAIGHLDSARRQCWDADQYGEAGQ